MDRDEVKAIMYTYFLDLGELLSSCHMTKEEIISAMRECVDDLEKVE